MQSNLKKHPRASGSPEYYGFHRVDRGWVYREYAPGTREVRLAGEFNSWDWESHPLLDLGNGSWVVYLPGENALWEGCRVQTRIDGIRCQTSWVSAAENHFRAVRL